ncbi:LysR family transcriptional regulator [Bradyrhizobium sp. CB3481]|uniref:LysR family transcriptional regulator n=1 Tax=Bradyrhizobium sp. CB3481 TaxID=3039158 RepID=UPI0024B24E7E|nr:LysR family transcriptional regulator [Bradyrhizobium sp. CB3481]WFU15077.1 LysR family transcriptional regulator [Bradyrhizobium sp. CB3481]
MERLDDLEAFVAVIEKGSQAAASRHLRRPLQSLNRSLIALERSVGVELVKRTTRRSEPTEAGKLFYERIKPAVAEIIEARNEAASLRGEVSGPLKVGAPVLFASSYVAPIIGRFLKLYPKVEIELKASDDQADLVAEGLDMAVRIGVSADEQLTARRLQALRVVTCAAPSYLAQHGVPKHPDELGNHHCVLRSGTGPTHKWPFRIGGKLQRISVSGRFHSNSAAAIRAAAGEGVGFAQLPLWQIRELVEQGALTIVLPEFETEGMPIQLVWPPTKAPLERMRRFTDFLASALKAELL